MRLTPCALLPAVAYAANLYIYDAQTSNPVALDTTSINADVARLVIASRLGLDRYHDLGTSDPSVLSQIDQLSGQQSLFASQDASVAFVLTQESKHGNDLPSALESSSVQSVGITDSPSFPVTEKLIRDLALQSGLHSDIPDLRSDFVASSSGPVFRIAKDSETLASTLDTLISQHYTILTLSVPKTATIGRSYGSYSMPPISLQKRQYKEAPLITDSKTSAEPQKSTLISSNNTTTPLRGILPHCFASLSACQSTTRNCTGHGSCSLIHTDRDASELSGKCYACTCKAEVVNNKNGKKTTRWGGPACQKKDVVVPFWLLASFSVFFAFVVSWGIGLLYTMGSQELPSVIGAGVSGIPRAK